jgi:hypothetical protein
LRFGLVVFARFGELDGVRLGHFFFAAPFAVGIAGVRGKHQRDRFIGIGFVPYGPDGQQDQNHHVNDQAGDPGWQVLEHGPPPEINRAQILRGLKMVPDLCSAVLSPAAAGFGRREASLKRWRNNGSALLLDSGRLARWRQRPGNGHGNRGRVARRGGGILWSLTSGRIWPERQHDTGRAN